LAKTTDVNKYFYNKIRNYNPLLKKVNLSKMRKATTSGKRQKTYKKRGYRKISY